MATTEAVVRVEPSALSEAQRARVEALKVARSSIATQAFLKTEVSVAVNDLVDLAEYVIHGTHPLDHWRDVVDDD